MNSNETLVDCLANTLIIFNIKKALYLHDNENKFLISELQKVNFSYYVQTLDFHYYALMCYDSLVIGARNMDEISKSLEQLFWTKSWNRNALVVLTGLDDNLSEILKILWRFYIVNVVILKGQSFYTYHPITIGKCAGKDLEAEWICNCSNLHLLLDVKHDSNIAYYDGCTIRVASINVDPYVIEKRTTGTEVLLTQEIEKRIRINYQYVDHNFQHHGEIINGSLTKMYKMLWERKIDILFGASKAQAYLLDRFEGTHVTHIFSIAFIVPGAELMSVSEQLVRIFSKKLWLMILITQFVILAILYLYTQLNHKSNRMLDYLFKALNVTFSSYNFHFKSAVLNILFFNWSFLSMFLTMLFTNSYMTFLAKPHRSYQISTPEEIGISKYRVGGYSINKELFVHNSNIYNRWENCSLQSNECLEYVLKSEFVLFKSIDNIRYQLMDRGETNVFECKPFIYSLLWLLTTRGFPMYDRFNELILRFKENGLHVKWHRDTMYKTRKPRMHDKVLIKFNAGFNVLVFGYILATLAFFGERIIHKASHKSLK